MSTDVMEEEKQSIEEKKRKTCKSRKPEKERFMKLKMPLR